MGPAEETRRVPFSVVFGRRPFYFALWGRNAPNPFDSAPKRAGRRPRKAQATMKTKAQKKSELERGEKLLDESRTLLFADLSRIKTSDFRRLREEIKNIGGNIVVIKKRLLGIIFKKREITYDVRQSKLPVAAIFSKADTESTSGVVHKFFSALEAAEGQPKDAWLGHIMGGYDIKGKAAVAAEDVRALGKLPPRDVVLGQLLGMLAAPIRSFLYILKQKVAQAGVASQTDAATSTPQAASGP